MPSMQAWSALIGSISVTMTREPDPLSAAAQPLPTSPKPHTSERLPPSITSVARMMPSVREWRQPYTLSNFDFVTQSFTLMAGKSSSPFAAIFFRRATPVVVSSDTPRIDLPIFVHLSGSFWIDSRIRDSTHLNSGLLVEAGSGSDLSFAYCASYLVPSWIRSVASPPSSTSMSGPSLPGHVSICSVHHQYSSSVSPFHANTEAVPAFAIAEAAWSCVEKMLQLAQRTFAPSAARVSMSTPVWMVMCREPDTFTPLRGRSLPSARQFMSPGISTSARSSSLRPNSASDMSFTLESAIALVLKNRARFAQSQMLEPK